jgi:hypothetical protein
MCRAILGSILGCLAISPKASRRSLAWRVPLALVVNNDLPVRSVADRASLSKIVAAIEFVRVPTEARSDNWSMCGRPDAERWRKGAEVSGHKKE